RTGQRRLADNEFADNEFKAQRTTLLAASVHYWSDVAASSRVIETVQELGRRRRSGVITEGPSDQVFLTAMAEWLASGDRVRPRQAVAAAQHATAAASAARDSLVHEHPSVSRDTVARFTSTWLGFQPTDEIVDAAAAALLYAPLDDLDPDDDTTAVRR